MLEQKIVENSSIWDLHIHTCKCPKGNDEFSKLSVKDYVDGLVKLFKNYPLLKMISLRIIILLVKKFIMNLFQEIQE